MKEYIDNLLNNPEVQRDTDRLYIMRLAEVYQDLQEQGIELTPEKFISATDGHYNQLREACKYIVTALYLEGMTLDEAFYEPKNYSYSESGDSSTRTNEEIVNFYLTGDYKIQNKPIEPNKDEDSINQSKLDKIYKMLERYFDAKNPFNLPYEKPLEEKLTNSYLFSGESDKRKYSKSITDESYNLGSGIKDINIDSIIDNLSSQYNK